MRLTFGERRLERLCLDGRVAQRELGPDRAKALGLRVGQLRAADSLAALVGTGVPGRWEAMTGDLVGLVSARLTANWRLVVKPVGEGQLLEVVAVEVVSVEDYH